MARERGAAGINLVGLCCTGNELQMRRGVPMAGNHLIQELILVTGLLDAMVVDYQCIMPSLTDVAKCFHTAVISTADKAKFTGATHISFDPHRGLEIGREIVRRGILAYENRVPGRVQLTGEPVEMMAGFSVEAIVARSAARRSRWSTPSRQARSAARSVSLAATTRRSARTAATSR